jgi:hypothetical protein
VPPRLVDLATQDSVLMAQHQQFSVLGHVTAEQDRHGSEHTPRPPVTIDKNIPT